MLAVQTMVLNLIFTAFLADRRNCDGNPFFLIYRTLL